MTVAELIRTHRLKNNLSQGQLAKKLGYTTPQFVSNLERGLAQLPPRQVKKFARILQMDKKVLAIAVINDAAERLRKEIGVCI